MTLTIMIAIFAVFLAAGVPMGFAMGLGAFIALMIQGEVPLLQLPVRFFFVLDNFALMAVPLFIFAGELMNTGGITERIVAFSRAAIGHLRAGLAQVNILTSILFAGVSGSALADVAAIGSMLIPSMVKEGYKKEFAVVVTAASSLIGPIIPPSITAVIYGSITGVSIGKLFLAGVFPGLLAGGAMMVLTWALAGRVGAPSIPRSPIALVGKTFVRTSPALTMPLIIVGGIVFGIFTPTEAAGVAVVYGLIVSLLSRRLGWRTTYELILRSAKVTASALVILGGAGLFSWVLVREGAAVALQGLLLSISQDPVVLMLVLLALLFVVGMFIEGLGALIIVVPVAAPIAETAGIDPVQFGIVTIMMLLVGTITPPVGIIALLACRIAGIEYSRTFGILIPYILIVVLVILVVAFVPFLTTWLPSFI